MGRSSKERLMQELSKIRTELKEEVARMRPEHFDWAPAREMKTCRDLLVEIATTEKFAAAWLTRQAGGKWDDGHEWSNAEASVKWQGNDSGSALRALDGARSETFRYLNGCTEALLLTPLPLSPGLIEEFGSPEIEAEEILRWIARHEYYHLAQLITYRWILGDNPYKRTSVSS